MLAGSVNPILRASGLALLRQIEIRNLLHRWEIDSESEANMIALSSGDQRRVENWLAKRGFNLDHLPETGRPMTPCRRGFVTSVWPSTFPAADEPWRSGPSGRRSAAM